MVIISGVDTVQSNENGVFFELLKTENIEGFALWLIRIPAGLGIQVECFKENCSISTGERERERDFLC